MCIIGDWGNLLLLLLLLLLLSLYCTFTRFLFTYVQLFSRYML